MTRTIDPSEIRPGMTIRWEQEDLVFEFPVDRNVQFGDLRLLRTPMRKVVMIPPDTEVTVLSEPAPPQPEEPTEFGAKVIVNGRRFLRADAHIRPWLEPEAWTWCTWAHLCSLGLVTVIPDQGWTVPDTPEVPERIDEWPEDDEHLRDHKWRDVDGDVWVYTWDGWRWFNKHTGKAKLYGFRAMPLRSPWTRVTDA